jgi:hypothetical protein
VSPQEHRAELISVRVTQAVCLADLPGPVAGLKSGLVIYKTKSGKTDHHKMAFAGFLICDLLFKG